MVRVADLDPELLLATPTTAALAALARGDSAERAELFGAALEKIGSVAPRDRGAGLMGRAAVLTTLIRQRFGDDPRIEVVVGQMLESSDEDGLTRVMAATCMDDLTT